MKTNSAIMKFLTWTKRCYVLTSCRITTDSYEKQSIPITTTWHEKAAFTVILSVVANGARLPPMVIFKCKTMQKDYLELSKYSTPFGKFSEKS